MATHISKFDGENRWLSNFYESPLWYDGILYPTSEHAYQAIKTFDEEERKRIALLETPRQAKRHGKKVKLRDNWEDDKVWYMKDIIRAKFDQNTELKTKLVECDAFLEEGNWWGDTFWGICNGKGENHLGKILMELREEFRKEIQ